MIKILILIIGYLIGGYQWYNIGHKNGYVDGKCEDHKFSIPDEFKQIHEDIIKENLAKRKR